MTWKKISQTRTEELRATGIGNVGPDEPQKQYGLGRSCAEPGCPTILSRYNPNDRCYTHSDLSDPVLIDDKELKKKQRRQDGEWRRQEAIERSRQPRGK